MKPSPNSVDVEKLREQAQKAAAELAQKLGCPVKLNTGENYVDIIINIDDFIRSLIRKVKENVNPSVLQQIDIAGTRVLEYMVIRFMRRQV